VLQHGFTSSIRNWYANGYVEPLKQSYRLIRLTPEATDVVTNPTTQPHMTTS
jgi:hypothetical protein